MYEHIKSLRNCKKGYSTITKLVNVQILRTAKVYEVDTFYSKNAKIVTDNELLIDTQRISVDAFQCLQIKW